MNEQPLSTNSDSTSSYVSNPGPVKAVINLWSAWYRWYVLFALTLVYIINIADRFILIVLLESIKKEMLFSDTQLGLLTGFAFAFFYAFLGIPIARLADRKNRRNLITIALVVWSGMTAVCGTASQFWHLLLARVGVGVGEAGCTPPAVSIISDLFPQKKRATPLAIYSIGLTFGMMLGYIVGGKLNALYGWRIAFYAVGIPGIILALFVRLTVREPPRGMADGVVPKKEAIPLRDALKEMFESKSYRHMAIGTALIGIVFNGVGSWCAAFYERIYEMPSNEVGMWIGILAGTGGGIGTFVGGYFVDKLGQKNSRWFMWIPALAALAAPPVIIACFLVGQKGLSLALLCATLFIGGSWYPAILSMSQGLVSTRVRSMSMAMILFLISLSGGIGPTLAGWLSDIMAKSQGVNSLPYALCLVSLISFLAAVNFIIASKSVGEDLENKKL